MIQCCSCMQHFHKKCADLKSNHISPIWNCDYCRSLPKRLDTLTSHVEEMKVQLTKLCDLNSDLLGQISQKTIDYEKLLHENSILKQKLVAAELHVECEQSPQEITQTVPTVSQPIYQTKQVSREVKPPMSSFAPKPETVTTTNHTVPYQQPPQQITVPYQPLPHTTIVQPVPMYQSPICYPQTYAGAVRKGIHSTSRPNQYSKPNRYAHPGHRNNQRDHHQPQVAQPYSDTRICRKCNLQGHIARNCATVRCFKCSAVGHKSNQCWA